MFIKKNLIRISLVASISLLAPLAAHSFPVAVLVQNFYPKDLCPSCKLKIKALPKESQCVEDLNPEEYTLGPGGYGEEGSKGFRFGFNTTHGWNCSDNILYYYLPYSFTVFDNIGVRDRGKFTCDYRSGKQWSCHVSEGGVNTKIDINTKENLTTIQFHPKQEFLKRLLREKSARFKRE